MFDLKWCQNFLIICQTLGKLCGLMEGFMSPDEVAARSFISCIMCVTLCFGRGADFCLQSVCSVCKVTILLVGFMKKFPLCNRMKLHLVWATLFQNLSIHLLSLYIVLAPVFPQTGGPEVGRLPVSNQNLKAFKTVLKKPPSPPPIKSNQRLHTFTATFSPVHVSPTPILSASCI